MSSGELSIAKKAEKQNVLPQNFGAQFSNLKDLDIHRSKTGENNTTEIGRNIGGANVPQVSSNINLPKTLAGAFSNKSTTSGTGKKTGSDETKQKSTVKQSASQVLTMISEDGHAVFNQNENYDMNRFLQEELGGLG